MKVKLNNLNLRKKNKLKSQKMHLKNEMFHEIPKTEEQKSHQKVTVVGIGAVGMAAAFSVLAQVCIRTKESKWKKERVAHKSRLLKLDSSDMSTD